MIRLHPSVELDILRVRDALKTFVWNLQEWLSAFSHMRNYDHKRFFLSKLKFKKKNI